jgi:hypothetical protein
VTVSARELPDSPATGEKAVTVIELEHGHGGRAYVRLLDFGSSETFPAKVGVGVHGAALKEHLTAWMAPAAAMQLAAVLAVTARWPAEALECLAAAVRRAAAAAEGVQG